MELTADLPSMVEKAKDVHEGSRWLRDSCKKLCFYVIYHIFHRFLLSVVPLPMYVRLHAHRYRPSKRNADERAPAVPQDRVRPAYLTAERSSIDMHAYAARFG